MTRARSLVTVATLSAACLLALLIPGGMGRAADPAQAATDPVTILVKFTEILGEIEDADRGPSVTVHATGRMVVHYPPYMRKAGDYEAILAPGEVGALVRSLVARGLLDFDARAARARVVAADRARRERQAARGERVTMHSSSDPSTIVIELRANGRHNRVRWTGLRHDARHHPEVEEIQALAASARELQALMAHPGLVRTEP